MDEELAVASPAQEKRQVLRQLWSWPLAPKNKVTECHQWLVYRDYCGRIWKCDLIWKQDCRNLCSAAVTKHLDWGLHNNEGSLTT